MASDMPMPANVLVQGGVLPLLSTHIRALDRVVGGIFISESQGGVYLFGGDPGSGKSTLSLQLVGAWEHSDHVYITAEEPRESVAARAMRFEVPHVNIIHATPLGRIQEILAATSRRSLAIIDSLQKISVPNSSMGSPNSCKTIVAELRRIAEDSGITMVIICHVTKDDEFAGPKTVEHDVDAAFMLQNVSGTTARLLRCESKNRFAPSGTSAWLKMTGKGLVDATPDIMLPPAGLAGRVLSLDERGMPVEVQVVPVAATAPSLSVGVDPDRVRMVKSILGVPGKFMVRADGAMLERDTSADLAIAVAMLSAVTGKPLASRSIAWGQLTLDGRILTGPAHDIRAQSAHDLDLTPVLSPDHFKTLEDAIAVAALGVELQALRSAQASEDEEEQEDDDS
jgi:DNA repair protein RadA/Sms